MSDEQKKRPGAPKGNLNALKHGFYATKITNLPFQDVDEYDFKGLADEVSLFRTQIRLDAEIGSQIKTSTRQSLTFTPFRMPSVSLPAWSGFSTSSILPRAITIFSMKLSKKSSPK